MNNPQPRRYRVRAMYDVEGLTQQEIAQALGISQATVSRDLKSTVPPSGRTPGGAPVYPLGRRVCRQCPTVLCRYNPTPDCWRHGRWAEPATDREHREAFQDLTAR